MFSGVRERRPRYLHFGKEADVVSFVVEMSIG